MTYPIAHLGEVASFIRGITFKPDDVIELGSPGSVACLRTKNVQVELDISDVFAIPEGFVRTSDKLARAGDIAVSTANSWNLVGKASWVPDLPWASTAGGFIALLRAKSEVLFPRYLYHWVVSDITQANLRKCARQTTNISNLSIPLAQELEIPLPPLSEQKRIAGILDEASRLCRLRARALEKLNSLGQAIFQEMFGDPIEMPVSRLDWRTEALESCVDFIDYRGKTPLKAESGVRLVTAKNVKLGYINLEPKEFVEADTYDEWMTRGFPQTGDVLFTTEAPLGNVAILDTYGEKVVVGQRLITMKPDQRKLDNTFVMYLLMSQGFRKRMFELSTGSTVVGIKSKLLKQIKISFPSLSEQIIFKERVAKIDAPKKAAELSKSQSSDLFASLQHRAFRGEL